MINFDQSDQYNTAFDNFDINFNPNGVGFYTNRFYT